MLVCAVFFFFFFNDTATTEIYTLSLHDALPIFNQVLLTVEAAAQRGLEVACVVLMGQKEPDASSLDNASLLRDFLPVLAGFKGVFEFHWLGLGADDPGQIGVNVKKVEKLLAEIYEACKLRGPSGSGVSVQPSG